MAEPYDAPRRAEDVRGCVAGGDAKRALELLLDFANEFFGAEQADEVRVMSASFRDLASFHRQGEISTDELLSKRSRLNRNLLALLRELMERLEQEVAHA